MPNIPELSEISKQRIAEILPKIVERTDSWIPNFNPYLNKNLIDVDKLITGIVQFPLGVNGNLTAVECTQLMRDVANHYTTQGVFTANIYYSDIGFTYPPYIKFVVADEQKTKLAVIDPKKKDELLPKLKERTLNLLKGKYDPAEEKNLLDIDKELLRGIAYHGYPGKEALPQLTHGEFMALMESLKTELAENGWAARDYYSDVGFSYPPYLSVQATDLNKTGIVHIDEARKAKYLPQLEERLLTWPEQRYDPTSDHNSIHVEKLFSGVVDLPHLTPVQGRERLTPGEYQALMTELKESFNKQSKWHIKEFDGNGPFARYWLSFDMAKPKITSVAPAQPIQEIKQDIPATYRMVRLEFI